eukprot:408893-Pyramimonas_sp.AAC.1
MGRGRGPRATFVAEVGAVVGGPAEPPAQVETQPVRRAQLAESAPEASRPPPWTQRLWSPRLEGRGRGRG